MRSLRLLRDAWLCCCCVLALCVSAAVTDVFAPRIHSLAVDDWALLSPAMEQLLAEANPALASSKYYRPSPREPVPETALAFARDDARWKHSPLVKAPARLSMQVLGEGMHRQLVIKLTMPHVDEPVDLFTLLYLPRSCYVDTYELTNRHEYGVPAAATILHTYRSSVDVESPALTSGALAVGLEFQQVQPAKDGSVRLSVTVPIHTRYLRPAGAEDVQPDEMKATLRSPLVFARKPPQGKQPTTHFRHVFHESHLGRALDYAIEDTSGYRYVQTESDKDRVVLHYVRGDVRHKWLSLLGTFVVSICSLAAIVYFMMR